MAVNHGVVAALELATCWLEIDMPYPPDEMGAYYERLIIQATWLAILPPGFEMHKPG